MGLTHEQLVGRLAVVLASLHETPSLPDRLCEAGRQLISADGAAMTLAKPDGERVALCSTDEQTMSLVDLQGVLDQGPLIDAIETGVMQIASFDHTSDDRWAMLQEDGMALGYRGTLIAVPLSVKRRVVAVLSAHRQGPRSPDDPSVGTFLGAALATALIQDPRLEMEDYELPENWPSRAQIHQATGMIVAQVGVHPQDALALLKGQAFVQSASLVDVAGQVVNRLLNFRQLSIEGD